MQLADAIWTATALLHQENPMSQDFEVQEIVARAVEGNFVGGFRPGLQPHASGHCVANKKPAGGRDCMLYETTRGRRRLVRPGDHFHPDRNGKIRPEEGDLPANVRSLVGWYDRIYVKQGHKAGTVPVTSHNLIRQPSITSANAPLSSSRGSSPGSGPVFLGASGSLILPETLCEELGLKEGACLSIYREGDSIVLQPVTEDLIRNLRGRFKPKPGEPSLAEMREREHRDDRY